MTRRLNPFHWVLLVILAFFFQTTHASENRCGERVAINDVLVVDLADYVDEQAQFEEKLHQQAGDFIMVTEAPMQVRMGGNMADAINRASKSAAHGGCDLLVLLGEKVKETRWEGRITTTRYLMVHMGKRKSS
jgi:hypothetical protein